MTQLYYLKNKVLYNFVYILETTAHLNGSFNVCELYLS